MPCPDHVYVSRTGWTKAGARAECEAVAQDVCNSHGCNQVVGQSVYYTYSGFKYTCHMSYGCHNSGGGGSGPGAGHNEDPE